jgi:hypothetical protein
MMWSAVQADSARMLSVDRLGMNTSVVASRSPETPLNVRIAFLTPAEDRKALKDRLVELTRAVR